MRVINRMIEPDGGTVMVAGRDIMAVDPVELRRSIGYVIQQIGLFPHWSIAQNIATVPRLLRWDDARIASRVDELLTLVGMDPAQYRDRFPRELSGGQRQRVGVARALAADPPVMLMDEPFGAIDPITRARLQDEFLNILRSLSKTIVFVTHDIDEALKMGDRIAILRDGALVQYDTPGGDPRPARECLRRIVRRYRSRAEAPVADPCRRGARARCRAVSRSRGRRRYVLARRAGADVRGRRRCARGDGSRTTCPSVS